MLGLKVQPKTSVGRNQNKDMNRPSNLVSKVLVLQIFIMNTKRVIILILERNLFLDIVKIQTQSTTLMCLKQKIK